MDNSSEQQPRLEVPGAERVTDECVPFIDSQPCSPFLQPHDAKHRQGEGTSMDCRQSVADSARIAGSAEKIGILCMTISAFMSALMAVFVKFAGNSDLSTWEILFFRSCIVATASLIQLAWTGNRPWGERIVLLNLRGVLGVGAVSSLFFAVRYLPIADAIVFTFLTPVLITIAAPFVLREDSGNQWPPILCALLGVLLICQPSFLFGKARLSLTGVLFGASHAGFSAVAKMTIRALKEEKTAVKILYLAAYTTLLSGAAMVVDPSQWTMPSGYQITLLLGCGLSGLGVQLFMTLSLERLKAAAGMSISYSAIIWSELAGICLFHEIPNAWAIVGTIIVLCSTLYSTIKEALPVARGAPATPMTPIPLLHEAPGASMSP